MVVLSQPALESLCDIKTCKPRSNFFEGIPVIDLSEPDSGAAIVEACKEFGFFKVVNHGVSVELMTKLESEAAKFFSLPQAEKDKAGPPNPCGYGNKRIGQNGDFGWVEYLLFSTNPQLIPQNVTHLISQKSDSFWGTVGEYVGGVRKTASEVLERMAEGLKIEGRRNALSRLIAEEKSDSCFRLNHYPPCPELQALSGRNLIGFGEHTDPQVISVVRSNDTSGLQISLRDGAWVSVPPDHFSFFVIVGDSLQVLTNGRFRSVRHRVLADSLKSRISMIYFGGPPLEEKILPLPSLMEKGEESLYKEFTWCEYKKSAYNTKLADNRLKLFERNMVDNS